MISCPVCAEFPYEEDLKPAVGFLRCKCDRLRAYRTSENPVWVFSFGRDDDHFFGRSNDLFFESTLGLRTSDMPDGEVMGEAEAWTSTAAAVRQAVAYHVMES